LDDPKLPPRCVALLQDRANIVAISPVSAYELRFKALKDLLQGVEDLIEGVPEFAMREGFTLLPLTWKHAQAAAALPLPHREPFDRLLAGQAIVEGYDLLSVDAALDGLGVSRVW
jgi:PIN domain nuclease of toxin-antitoxin system